MASDPRLSQLRRSVAKLAASEHDLARKLERALQVSSGHPDTRAAIRHLRPMVQTFRDQLAAYLGDTGEVDADRETTSRQPSESEVTKLSEVLQDLSLAFQRCALGSATLFEVALRLYEPRLRELAAKHLKAHADAALSTAQLLPAAVVEQLARDGHSCSCICPMCSIGACGCVAYGTRTLTIAWRDTAATESGPPGFVLLSPKPESQLALAGVRGGDVLLAVDGHHVRTNDDIQAVIRSHALGEEVHFLIQRGPDSPRGLVVRHVSDYPKA